MDLYTSLVRLKQSMNSGELPPMTPVPESVRHVIDPSFTIGMGGLEEDFEKGLRCPVRDCGKYFHDLRKHMNRQHKGAGGAVGVLSALSIPSGVRISSQKLREMRSTAAKERGLGKLLEPGVDQFRLTRTPAHLDAARKASAVVRQSVAARNLQDKCVAQLTHRIVTLHQRIGRTPNTSEFKAAFSNALLCAVLSTFGSWANAIAQCGLPRARGMRWTTEDVLAAFAAWHAEHGELPGSDIANAAASTPSLPCVDVVLRVMDCAMWSEAMRRIASLLDIHGGRYGLPEQKSA